MNLTSDVKFIPNGTMPEEIVDFLRFIIPSGANVSVAGQVGSGKTTTLSQFPKYMDKSTRFLFRDHYEEALSKSKRQFKDYPHFYSLNSLLVNKGNKNQIETNYLYVLNPDVLVIDEIRDESDAKQALIGMNMGHIVWNTIHANSVPQAATRFLQLNGNTLAAANQIGFALDFIIFLKRLKSGVHVVTEVSEFLGYQGGTSPILNPIFKYDIRSNKHHRIGFIQSKSMLEKINWQEPDAALINHWCRPDKEVIKS